MNISKKATSSLRCTAAVAILALVSSCAKETTTYENDDVKLYLDAWMSVNHPGVQPTGLGVYIIDDQPGSGEAVTDDDYYYFIRYTATDLDGNISGTSEEKVAQQIGSYTKGNYYGSHQGHEGRRNKDSGRAWMAQLNHIIINQREILHYR